MPRINRRKFGAILVAFFAVLVAAIARVLLNPFIGHQFPFATLLLATLVASAAGGFWCGIFATFLSVIIAKLWLLPPEAVVEVTSSGLVSLVFFVCVSAGIAVLGGRMKNAVDRETMRSDELQRSCRVSVMRSSLQTAKEMSCSRMPFHRS